jgi:hypothetical protein
VNLTIFFFSGVAMHERMRYYIRNTRIMQGIEGYEHAGNPETRLARLPFRLSSRMMYVPQKASTRAIRRSGSRSSTHFEP